MSSQVRVHLRISIGMRSALRAEYLFDAVDAVYLLPQTVRSLPSTVTGTPRRSPSTHGPRDVFSAQPNQIRQITLCGRPRAAVQTHLTPALEAPDWQRWRRISLTALGNWRSDMVVGAVGWMLMSSFSVVRCRQVEQRLTREYSRMVVDVWAKSKSGGGPLNLGPVEASSATSLHHLSRRGEQSRTCFEGSFLPLQSYLRSHSLLISFGTKGGASTSARERLALSLSEGDRTAAFDA